MKEFQKRVDRYAGKCASLWESAHAETAWGTPVPLQEKLRREAEAERWRNFFEKLLRNYPESKPKQHAWKEELLRAARAAATACLGFAPDGVQLLFTRPALEASHEFIRQARSFDSSLTDEDLQQAIRNLWVIHALQLVLGEPLGLSPAGFAYSMLYPCTDNWLDNPRLSAAAKWRLGEWLASRLAGQLAAPPDKHASQIDYLIGLIESCFDRDQHPGVYFSLRAIHQAQLMSLRQQDPADRLDDHSLLRITIAKGGTSVLVDGYLVRGFLTEAEAEFAFGYGVLLQLMDDLQDLRSDAANRHATLVTRAAAAGSLEDMIARLWSFTDSVLSHFGSCAGPGFLPLKSLIQDNCRLMLLHAAARNAERLAPSFLECLEAVAPFRLAYLASREESLGSQYKRVVSALGRHHVPGIDGETPMLQTPRQAAIPAVCR
jgi:hypothetical protein